MSKQDLSLQKSIPMIAAKRKAASQRRYGAHAQQKVGDAMHEMKLGVLKSGRSNKKVSSRKQAIAIGLSEARKEGAKVPTRRKAASKRKATAGPRKAASKRQTTAGPRKAAHKRKATAGTRKAASKRKVASKRKARKLR